MNLKVQLFYRILFIAIFCLTASAVYVLYQTDQQAISEANFTADRIEKQVESQLLQMFARYDFSSTFPNTELWPDINGLSGSCIQFLSSSQSRRRNLCDHTIEAERTWPLWFGNVYQKLFSPGFEVRKDISFNAMAFGSVLVTLNKRIETARAWNNLRAVIGVLFISIFAVCILVYFTINRMLKPAQLIVTGLEKMREGQLDTRLPSFDVIEWKRTSKAINSLAANQSQIMTENKQLVLKLMNIQEEEQRYISREMHDEFGQCLSGMNALTTSLEQSAKTRYPTLVAEIQSISQITRHMMDIVRNMLTRLRPADVDDLGLATSLKKLINSWNTRSQGQTQYQITIDGNIEQLPDPLPVNIYRIVQECLTNIAKHADATQANVMLSYTSNKDLLLIITDNGITEDTSFDNSSGIGLLGIRERVLAIGGALKLTSQKASGFTVKITIPIQVNTGDN